MLDFLSSDEADLEIIENDNVFSCLKKEFRNVFDSLRKRGKTAQLWLQYFEMVTLVQQFIHAERTGNFQLHLHTIQKMLPFFHSSGHFLYAKTGHFYLQKMLELEGVLNVIEYSKFISQGFFSIRRTDKPWSGVWSDMTIEQTLMRSMHGFSGFTHGKGYDDSVIAKWILGMPTFCDISEQIEEFCQIYFHSSEQHKDLRKSRMERDDLDLQKLEEWLTTRDPFYEREDLISLSTGVVGNDSINCYKAAEVGNKMIEKIINLKFDDIKCKRKDRVLPLSCANCTIKINGQAVPIDPLKIFQRICILKKLMTNFVNIYNMN